MTHREDSPLSAPSGPPPLLASLSSNRPFIPSLLHANAPPPSATTTATTATSHNNNNNNTVVSQTATLHYHPHHHHNHHHQHHQYPVGNPAVMMMTNNKLPPPPTTTTNASTSSPVFSSSAMTSASSNAVAPTINSPILTGNATRIHSIPLPGGMSNKPTLRIFNVALLVFFTVSGGPMGSEDAVGAGGPALALSMYALFPLIYALPVALVTGELASLFPEDSSFTLWVNEAFGPFWALQEGVWSLVAGMTNNAMYMIMVIEIFERGVFGALSPVERWFLGVSFAVLASIPNFMGVRMVGRSLNILIFVVLGPYLLLILCAIPHFNWSTWERGPAPIPHDHTLNDVLLSGGEPAHHHHLMSDVARLLPSSSNPDKRDDRLHGVTLLFSTAFWNFGGFDSASSYAGEVSDPARTYPVALLASLALITVSLILPLAAATLASGGVEGIPPYSEWEDGTYVDIAYHLGGTGLTALVALSGLASQIAMFTTEMFVDTHLLYGMAQQKLAHRAFLTRDVDSNAPIAAVFVFLLFIIFGFTFLDRLTLLVMNNTFAGGSVLLEVGSAVRLRRRTVPLPPNSYRAPCTSSFTLALALLPAVLISFYVVTPAILFSGAWVAFVTLFFAFCGVVLGWRTRYGR